MRRFSWCLSRLTRLALGLLAPASLAPTPASACSRGPLYSFGLSTYRESIPSNGVLAGVLLGCASCAPRDLQVFDAAGGKVPGTFIELPKHLRDQRWFAFRPETPWIEGVIYRVEGPQVDSPQPGQETKSSLSFSVRPAFAGQAQVSARLEHAQRGIDPVGCIEWDPWFSVGCGVGGVGFYTRNVFEAQLIVEADGVESSQYAYRVVWTRDGQPVEPDFSGALLKMFPKTFEGIPSEVCFELFATPLAADGVERSIARECKRVDLEGLGTKDATPSIDGTLAQCLVPPPAYQAEWCKILARDSAWCKPHDTRGLPQSCQRARQQCGESESEGENQGDAAADADASMIGSEAAAEDEASAGQDPDGGCNVRRPGANPTLLALLGLVGLVYARRRTRGTSY